MTKYFSLLLNFFSKHYTIFLLLIVLLSYGQILGMYVWKDDNAVFFKFTHINEDAGYLGKGLFGEGPYKFSVTPYYFVYKVFGYESIIPFYVLVLTFYFISTVTVYKLFSAIISEKSGKIAAFLFAAGYIASEGFTWLASSMIINVSIILACIVVLVYHKFLISKKFVFLLASWIFYFLLIFLTPVRSHYLIGVIILMDITWLFQKLNYKSFFDLILRLVPFMVTFYWLLLKDLDPRAFSLYGLIGSILSGEYYKMFSFFSSLGYLLVPDRQIEWLIQLQLGLDITKLLILIVFLGFVFFMIWKRVKSKIFLLGLILLSVLWFFLSKGIYSAPQINADIQPSLAVFLGGLFLEAFLIIIIFTQGKMRWLAILFSFWLVANLYSYTSYLPINALLSVDRYLAHSFIPLVGLLSLSFAFRKNASKYNVLICLIVIAWGVINLSNSIIYNHQILVTRSIPAKEFYRQLRQYMPQVKKGDVLFFDVAPDAQPYFNAAFSVGQMPESTAIAWRYGLDRYDFQMLDSFSDLIKAIKQGNISPEKVHTFWYSRSGLFETSKDVREAVFGQGLWQTGNLNEAVSSRYEFNNSSNKIHIIQPDLNVKLEQPVFSAAPLELKLKIVASYANLSLASFPFYFGSEFRQQGIWQDSNFRSLALEYKKAKNNVLKDATYSVSSEWQNRTKQNIYDNDLSTIWQADRVLWDLRKEYILVDLGQPMKVDKVVWFNGVGNSAPTKYSIDASDDNINWQEVASVSSIQRIEPGSMQIVQLKSTGARFISLNFWDTLDGDSPAIAELWVVPADFIDLDLKKAEELLQSPFAFVADDKVYRESLSKLNYEGGALVSWLYDGGGTWQSNSKSKVNIVYDSVPHDYHILIPAGGDKIKEIKLSDIQIPGNISVLSIEIRHPKLDDLQFSGE